MDDIFVYNISDNAWQKPVVSGKGPAARNAAVACLADDNSILLHGGWNPFKLTYDDSYILK